MQSRYRLTRTLRFVLLLLSVMMAVAVSCPVPAGAVINNSQPLIRLAYALKDAPLPMRSDFAWLALTQMAAFYSEEATRARDEPGSSSKARDAASWAMSVDDFARRIASMADSISSESSITLAIGISNEVHVYVDSQPIILTAALSSQQADYEQRVLERFCTLYACADLLQDIEFGEPEVVEVSPETNSNPAYWSFSQYAGPVCMTDDGLEFQFQQLTDLAGMRTLCSLVVNELDTLAMAIAHEQQQGIRIDWDRLSILPAAPGLDNRVILAERLEASLALPLLAERSALLRLVRPWLKARAQGESYQLIVLNAEHMLGLTVPMNGVEDSQRYPAFDSKSQ